MQNYNTKMQNNPSTNEKGKKRTTFRIDDQIELELDKLEVDRIRTILEKKEQVGGIGDFSYFTLACFQIQLSCFLTFF